MGYCHFVASMLSGLVTTIASMPVDIMKTRLQSMGYVDGVPEYKGAGDVLAQVVKKEGFFSLWKGFTPYYFRLGPHTVITFILLEQMNIAYKLHVLGIKGGSGGAVRNPTHCHGLYNAASCIGQVVIYEFTPVLNLYMIDLSYRRINTQ